MFSSSVRRVALTTSPTPIACISTCAPRTVASQALSYRSHQRRLSSSKPSSPADGSRRINEAQAVPGPASEGKKSDELQKSRKKKAKNVAAGRDESMLHLPRVPSTQHIAPKDICDSSFFSLHRPISLTKSFPTPVTEEAFAAIFAPRTRTNKPIEVINVLTKQVKLLEGYRRGMEHENGNEEAEAQMENSQMEQGMNFPVLSGKYRPFNPPPAPIPMNSAESLAAGAEAAELSATEEADLEPQHRTYTAVLTIEESTDSNGDVTYMAHSSPLVAELPPASPPTKFLERMQIRQEQNRERREEQNDMFAISVKRQRKLKMKKHKYKKLMRRTRNLRRRLDRN